MKFVSAVILSLGVAGAAAAQSSSLYINDADNRMETEQFVPRTGMINRLSPAVAQTSYSAVRLPEPRQFQVHDLMTIVIRESTETDFEAQLDTKKDVKVDGEISDFPSLQLSDLIEMQLRPSSMDEGIPKLGVKFKNDFKTDGEYSRRESITGRITARVVDVKPNGTLVLEARKFIQSDKESLDMVLTGMCRAEDVSLDNTVLSTQLYDLHMDKQHTGELRKTTKKGLLTKLLEAVFNF